MFHFSAVNSCENVKHPLVMSKQLFTFIAICILTKSSQRDAKIKCDNVCAKLTWVPVLQIGNLNSHGKLVVFSLATTCCDPRKC